MKGMDTDAVRTMGNKLQGQHHQAIQSVIDQVEGMVNDTNATWVGADAERFRGWWPEKRSALIAIRDDLHGFGQSAINNASEQDDVSER